MGYFRSAVILALCVGAIVASFLTTSDFVLAIASGVLSGLIASISLILVLSDFRPRISISPFILIAETRAGARKFSFKVINNTGADLIEPQATAHLYFIQEIDSGGRRNAKVMPLVNDKPLLIKKRRKSEALNDHIYIFNTLIDDVLKQKLNEFAFVRFRIVGQHPVSGVQSVFEKHYPIEAKSFRSGVYKPGEGFKIDASETDFFAELGLKTVSD